jgi:hAT family protein
MARDFLAISATGVPVERLFSQAPHLLTRYRQSLSHETIRKCICLRYWLLKDRKLSEFLKLRQDAIKFKLFGDGEFEAAVLDD